MAYINGRYHEIEAWNGESSAIPPGSDYVFQVEAVEQKPSSNKGTLQLVVTNVVRGGEHDGRKAIFRYSITDSAGSRGRIKALALACGVQFDQNGGFDDTALIGRVYLADVIHEPYTKTDPVTGQELQKSSARCQNERPYVGQQAAAPQGYAPQPGAAAPAPQQMYAPPAGAPVPMAPPAPNAPVGRPVYPPPAGGRGAPAGLTQVR